MLLPFVTFFSEPQSGRFGLSCDTRSERQIFQWRGRDRKTSHQHQQLQKNFNTNCCSQKTPVSLT